MVEFREEKLHMKAYASILDHFQNDATTFCYILASDDMSRVFKQMFTTMPKEEDFSRYQILLSIDIL